MRRFWISLAITLASVALPGIARADALFQVGGAFSCPSNSCLGGSYTLQFLGDNSGSTFTVTLTATTPGSTSSSPAFGDFITSAAFGDGKDISSASLISAPGGTGSWDPTIFGSLDNAGCSSGSAPNVCNNQALSGGLYTLAPADGSTYSWTWIVTFATPGLDLNPADMHIGLQYENGSDHSSGLIVSESGVSTPVPEPSSALLLGAALLGIACLAGRKLIAP